MQSPYTLKGINQLTILFHSGQSSLPVAYELIKKDQLEIHKKTGKSKWVSSISKHELLRRMIRQCVDNNLLFKYVLADCWYSCAETFRYIDSLKKHFIMPLKANPKVALSEADHQQGRYQSIESLVLKDSQLLTIWLEGLESPLPLTRQVFKDGDPKEGDIYLVTNDLTGPPARTDSVCIQTQYARRWKVEEFPKSSKSNVGYGASPAHTVRSQSNHLFLVMLAFVKLEALRVSTKKNHFALKKLLTLNATKLALRELNSLKSRSALLAKAA